MEFVLLEDVVETSKDSIYYKKEFVAVWGC